MKNLLFFDIDGTLIPHGVKEIPKETVDLIKSLDTNKNEVFICTGRCYHQAKKEIETLGFNNHITSNGQEVYYQGKEIYKSCFKKEEVRELVSIMDNFECGWAYETRTNIFVPDRNFSINLQDALLDYGFQDVIISDKHLEEDIFQIWCFDLPEKVEITLQNIPKKYKSYKWNELSAEILPGKESKGNGINKVKELMPGRCNVISFGDGVNDIEMFEISDVAVVMGNAESEIKKYADFVTGDCDKGGIKEAFERLGIE